MLGNGRLPIFESWATRYDQSVQTDQGIFASYNLIFNEVVRVARLKPGSTLNLALVRKSMSGNLLPLPAQFIGV